jgi:hypothetical protein
VNRSAGVQFMRRERRRTRRSPSETDQTKRIIIESPRVIRRRPHRRRGGLALDFAVIHTQSRWFDRGWRNPACEGRLMHGFFLRGHPPSLRIDPRAYSE